MNHNNYYYLTSFPQEISALINSQCSQYSVYNDFYLKHFHGGMMIFVCVSMRCCERAVDTMHISRPYPLVSQALVSCKMGFTRLMCHC